MSEVKKTGESKLVGIYHQVPFRMFSPHYQRVEGLRNYMNEPRNKVLNSLIEIALDQVLKIFLKTQKFTKQLWLKLPKSILVNLSMVLEIYLMIKLEGIVLNVFTQQGGQNKKGESFDDRDKVQILGAMDLPNGDVKNELFTLSVENYRDFSDFLNQKISIPVGAMASGRNVIFYVAKGAQPELAKTV